MMAPSELQGPLAALLAGLITSLHCVGMCGPLSCGVCLKNGTRKGWSALGVYHLMRLVSYSAVGALVGAVGRLATGGWVESLSFVFPWLFVFFFLFVAVGWDKRAGRAVGQLRFFQPLFAKVQQTGAVPGAAMLGAATPFLPCGPLYLVLGAAALSGSAAEGSLLLAAFAVGVIPFFGGVQAGLFRLGGHISPSGLEMTRRGLAAASVALLFGRMAFNGGFESSSCLMCP